MKSVDRTYVRLAWARAFWDTLFVIGAWGTMGVGFQFLADMAAGKEIGWNTILVFVGFISGSMFLSNAFSSFASWRAATFNRTLDDKLNLMIVDKLKDLDLGRLSDPSFLELKDNAHSRGVAAVSDLWEVQRDVIKSIAGVTVAFGVLTYLNPWLCLVAALPVLPQAYRSFVVQQRRRELHERHHMARRRRNEYESMLTGNRRLVQTKLFGFVQTIRSRYISQVDKQREEQFELDRYNFRSNVTMQALEAFIFAFCLAYLGMEAMAGNLSVTKIFVFFGSLRAFETSLFEFAHQSFVELHTKHQDYCYLKDLLAVRPYIDESAANQVKFTETPAIDIRDVSFAYPSRPGNNALDGCSLRIDPGEKIALIGKNGSGKTTLARIVAKVYVPDSGSVLYGGIDSRNVTQDSWLGHLTCVIQGASVPRFDIAFSLTGQDATSVDMPTLVLAAEMSGAHEFVRLLANGYGTQIGEEWPGGVDFSTGQEQRLFLAGAFYRLMKPEVRIAVFDEPMAHCDTQTRERFYSSLRSFDDKTIVVIAHDPLYLNHFERVVVMDNGKVVADLKGRDEIERYRSSITHRLASDL